MEMKAERRDSERHGLETEVVYEPSAALKLKQKNYVGKTINISKGGFCFKTETPLTRSQIIQVRMPIPEIKSSLPTLAEVRWIEGAETNDAYTVGLRFLL
ncbi:MAG: PilZ domain-containing protein [Nitrospiria bacterium]